MSVTNALNEDKESVLEELALTLAKAIDAGPSDRDLSALVKQLREVMDELELIRPAGEQEETFFERLKREREERTA